MYIYIYIYIYYIYVQYIVLTTSTIAVWVLHTYIDLFMHTYIPIYLIQVYILKKVKDLGQIPDGAILVTADVVGLYPSLQRQVQRLRPKLHLLTLVFSWMKLKWSFLKVKSYILFYGFVILTTYFLYGLMEHRNWILLELNKFHRNLSFTYETSKERVNFLDLNVSLGNSAISADLYVIC